MGFISWDLASVAVARTQALVEQPVSSNYRGVDVYKLDVWTQGPALLQSLNILENFDLRAMGYNSASYIHTLYQAMNLAFADRDFYYGDTRALQNRERVQRDSINYFPPSASRPCALTFFPDLDSRALPVDQVEVNPQRACLGRLYFRVPGGITHGQHWLNVKFDNSLIRVPFRILTEDEEKMLSKNYKDIQKQVKAAFEPKKKN